MPIVNTKSKNSTKSSDNPFSNPELRHLGIDVYIDISRLSGYYIINQLVPIYVLVLVSMVTYVHNPSKIDVRIAVNLTCFLALTAIKWVINRELPNSSYPTTVSMIIVTAYALFGFAVVESIVVHTVHKKAKEEEDEKEKMKEYQEMEVSSPKAVLPTASHPSSSSRSQEVPFQSPSAKRWNTFSKGIRKVKGDHDNDVTELAIIIDMCSLAFAVVTTMVSSTIYFTV